MDIVSPTLRIILILAKQIRKAHNSIHRRTDVMAHIEEESRLCLVCHLCLFTRFHEHLLVILLTLYEFINTFTPHNHDITVISIYRQYHSLKVFLTTLIGF